MYLWERASVRLKRKLLNEELNNSHTSLNILGESHQ
jgi:hypothetical protein